MSPSPDPNSPCLACAIVRGERRPPGGVVWRGDGLVLHGLADPSPLPGWLVLTTERHARGLYDLDDRELRALGPAAAAAMRAQRAALGAEHVYALALGDVLLHFHLHLVPRFADTPPRLRGRGAFDAAPADARPPEEIERAAAMVAAALAGR
jgi:diadenosine tetraphosphate (Ap4A) HIT family hydrolase